MAVADDALAEILHVSLLCRQQRAPGGFHSRLVPAIDRPLRRLAAVVVLQRLAAQSKPGIARQITARFAVRHFDSNITPPLGPSTERSPDGARSKPGDEDGGRK